MKRSFSFIEWTHRRRKLRGSVHQAGTKTGPWAIFAHGLTGQRLGPHYLFVRIARELARHGISSLRFDFGGSGESEGAFHEMTLTTMKSDLHSAIRIARRRYTPSHLVLVGHSLGGCVAACCAGKNVDGLVLLAPVASPQQMARRRRDILDRGPNERGFYEYGPHEMSLGFLDALRDVDPVAEPAGSFRGGLMVIQGDADPSVSIRESGRYVHWARKAGIDTGYHLLKNVDHNFSTVRSTREVCSTISTWIRERCG